MKQESIIQHKEIVRALGKYNFRCEYMFGYYGYIECLRTAGGAGYEKRSNNIQHPWRGKYSNNGNLIEKYFNGYVAHRNSNENVFLLLPFLFVDVKFWTLYENEK